MKFELGKEYIIKGKVDAINRGLTFYNTTVFNEDKVAINIKLNDDDKVVMGQIYEFKVLTESKEERPEDLVLVAKEINKAEDVCDVDEVTKLYKIFYEYAPIELELLQSEIEKYLQSINNKVIKDIVNAFYNEYKNRFYIHPAATKFHHAYIGGLAYHTMNMLKMGEDMTKLYNFLSYDLLIGGILIHDICKVDEMTGVDGEYTDEGLLIGHIVLGTSKVEEIAKKLGYEKEEEVLLLKHMMVSHHGQLLFGSPKKPQIAEALMLWYIDTIDSKFQVIGETLDVTVDSTFTAAIPVADKGRFLKHKLTNK